MSAAPRSTNSAKFQSATVNSEHVQLAQIFGRPLTKNPALIIIDVQEAIDFFSEGDRNNPDMENTIATLLMHWRIQQMPIFHVQHSSKFPESPSHASSPHFNFKIQVAPQLGEVVIQKRENCALIGTDLAHRLRQQNIQELVIVGVVTNNSIDATVRVAAGNGFRVYVAHDACAAYPMRTLQGQSLTAEEVHWIFLSNLAGEYAQILSAHELMENKK